MIRLLTSSIKKGIRNPCNSPQLLDAETFEIIKNVIDVKNQ